MAQTVPVVCRRSTRARWRGSVGGWRPGRGPGDAGCQRVSHFCGALAVRVLRRARPAHGAARWPVICVRMVLTCRAAGLPLRAIQTTWHWSRSLAGAGSSPGACTALAEPGTRIVQARDPRTTEMSMRMRLCKTPISSSSLSLSFLSLSQCRRAHTHTLIYTQVHLPGTSLAICAHLLPCVPYAARMISSSAGLHGPDMMLGSNCLTKRFLHCTGVRLGS